MFECIAPQMGSQLGDDGLGFVAVLSR